MPFLTSKKPLPGCAAKSPHARPSSRAVEDGPLGAGGFRQFHAPQFTPTGTVFPTFHNLAAASHVLEPEDTPAAETTDRAGWQVLEPLSGYACELTIIVAVMDWCGRLSSSKKSR